MASWRPTASIQQLQARARLLRDIREFFHSQGFDEVQTPVLGRESVIDRHLDPVRVPTDSLQLPELHDSGQKQDFFFLQTSPEFAMKRLVAAGMQRIYQIGPVFRAGERGDLHNPEFTMVEWYRVGDGLQAGIDLLKQLILSVSAFEACEQCTYQSAFQKFAGCDPLNATLEELQKLAGQSLEVEATFSEDRDDWLNLIFDAFVQPQLGLHKPLVLTHYPASQSALARVDPHDPRTCQRFELFIDGIELANGYHELTDANELASRNSDANRARCQDHGFPLPETTRLLAAMRHGLPECSGCAMGIDRLQMVLTKAAAIDEVLAFPIERS
jgi:lysyl-tRNA synthetase class 2